MEKTITLLFLSYFLKGRVKCHFVELYIDIIYRPCVHSLLLPSIYLPICEATIVVFFVILFCIHYNNYITKYLVITGSFTKQNMNELAKLCGYVHGV